MGCWDVTDLGIVSLSGSCPECANVSTTSDPTFGFRLTCDLTRTESTSSLRSDDPMSTAEMRRVDSGYFTDPEDGTDTAAVVTAGLVAQQRRLCLIDSSSVASEDSGVCSGDVDDISTHDEQAELTLSELVSDDKVSILTATLVTITAAKKAVVVTTSTDRLDSSSSTTSYAVSPPARTITKLTARRPWRPFAKLSRAGWNALRAKVAERRRQFGRPFLAVAKECEYVLST